MPSVPDWLGPLIGLASLLVAYILYRKSRAGAQLVYQRRALPLIGVAEPALPEEIEISFKGHNVPRLTSTDIILWNAGRSTIHGQDVVEKDPLRLVFSETSEVLRARVICETRKVNDMTVGINANAVNEVSCKFDYLDPYDGAVIEILHTDEERFPEVLGTIRGIPQGVRDWGRIPHRKGLRLPLSRRTVFLVPILLGAVTAAYGVFRPAILSWLPFLRASEPISEEALRMGLVVAGMIYAILPALAIWQTRQRFPRKLRVDDLE